MLKRIAPARAMLAMLAMLASGADAQEMRQFFAETSTPLPEITAHLAPVLPDSVALTEAGENAYLSYSGMQTPPGLAGFLTSAFETLEPTAIAPGQTVSITLVMTRHSARTDLSLMVLGRFDAPEGGITVDGGQVIMDGRGAEPCTGQVIIQHALAPDETLDRYVTAHEDAGFVFEDETDATTSFFFGQGPDCAVALYVEGETGGSTAVIRYLEE